MFYNIILLLFLERSRDTERATTLQINKNYKKHIIFFYINKRAIIFHKVNK